MTFRPAPTTTLAVGLLVAIATLPLQDVFGGWEWAISVIGAAVVGAIVASAIESTRRDIPLPYVAFASLAGATVWSLVVSLRDLFWSAPTGSAIWHELGSGITNGWGALLEEQVTLTDPRGAETFAAFFAWMCAAASIHLIARVRSALPGIGAAAVMLGISTAAALKQGIPSAIFGAAVGAIALFAISTVARARDQQFKVSRAFSLSAVIALASGAALVAAIVTSILDREPLDPRTSRGTQLVDIEVPDILAEFSVRRTGTDPVMQIESSASIDDVRLRLQVYDAHDGERWLPSTDFRELASFPTPEELPAGEAITLDITIQDLDGPWIPVPDRVTDIDLQDLRWNDESQTIIMANPPDSYRVGGTVVGRTGHDGLNADRLGIDDRLSETPTGLPDEIRTIAEEAAAGAFDDATAIDAITARVRQIPRNESGAPGNSLGRLRDDLATGSGTGAEQIASIHALMLRAVGIPSRVVVGYVANGAVVSPADLQIWTETPFPGIGWVASDPVPVTIESGEEADPDPTASSTTLPEEPTLQARALPTELGPGEDPGEAAIGNSNEFTIVEAVLLAAAALIGVALLMVWIRTIRRRLRRSASSRPEVRVLGAWAEVVDRLRELGAPIRATTTIDDVADLAGEIDPSLREQTVVAGNLAAAALHAASASDQRDADQAWAQLRAIETTLVQVAGRNSTVRRFLDPRVLRHRAPRPPRHRDGGRRSLVGER